MNLIEQLREYVLTKHPSAVASLTPPLREDGVWSLDIDSGDSSLAIEWSADDGFGVTSVSADTFGEGPDEHFNTLEKVQRRVDQLLTNAEVTAPPFGVLLARLRERRGFTQKELASKLGLRQASISGMESRSDIQLTTLKRVVEALDGVLEIFASFGDARYRITTISFETQQQLEPVEPLKSNQEKIVVGSIRYEAVFIALREARELQRAIAIANDISSRHAVLEIP